MQISGSPGGVKKEFTRTSDCTAEEFEPGQGLKKTCILKVDEEKGNEALLAITLGEVAETQKKCLHLEEELDCLSSAAFPEQDRVDSCLNRLSPGEEKEDGGVAELFSKLLSSRTSLNGVLDGLVLRDVLKEPMQTLVGAYEPWLERYRESNPESSDLVRCQSQIACYRDILNLCGDSSIESNSGEKLQEAMLKLQELGEPPQEVLNALFGTVSGSGDEIDETKGLDAILKSIQSVICDMTGVIEDKNDSTATPSSYDKNIKEDQEAFLKFLENLGLKDPVELLNSDWLLKAVSDDMSESDFLNFIIKEQVFPESKSNEGLKKSCQEKKCPNDSSTPQGVDCESACRQM